MLSPRSACSLLVSSLVSLVALDAAAHVSLDYPKSRYYSGNQADQNKLKNGPCGVTGDSRTTNASLITTFKPGEKITVKWRETIQHPGYFRIAFDSDGQDFTLPGTTNLGDGVTVLADKIMDKTTSDYTLDVTLPNMECSKCTLQLIQVMTTDPPPFEEGPGKDLYFNCADIVLSGSAGGNGGAGGTSAGGANAGGASTGGRSSGGVGGVNSTGMSAGGMNGGDASGGPGQGGTSNGAGGSSGGSTGGSNANGGASATGSGGAVNAQGGSSNPGNGGTTASGGASGGGGAQAANGGSKSSGGSQSTNSNGSSSCSFHIGRESGRSFTLFGLGVLGLALASRRRRATQRS